jgi:hypothetical protein
LFEDGHGAEVAGVDVGDLGGLGEVGVEGVVDEGIEVIDQAGGLGVEGRRGWGGLFDTSILGGSGGGVKKRERGLVEGPLRRRTLV